MKKHFLKFCGITDACTWRQIHRAEALVMVVSRAASHQSCTAVESPAPSPKRTRVTGAVTMRKKVIRCMGQRSPKLMAKWLLRMNFRRVHAIEVCTLLGQAQQAEVKKMQAKVHCALIGVTTSQRSMARAHIRCRIINAWCGVFDFFWFGNSFVNKVHCAPLVGSLSCLFCI